MIGTTLGAIREYVESLAVENGRYRLVCVQTGDGPAPARGLTFETRSTARAAATATEQYRAALARYDPTAPHYDVIVCERYRGGHRSALVRETADEYRAPAGRRSSPVEGHPRDRIDVCHTVAGAVFEAIAASPHGSLETAVMDTYLELAEEIERTDDLRLRLLESIAVELDARLDPTEQATVLTSAAATLPVPSPTDHLRSEPLDRVLRAFQAADLLERYDVTRAPVDDETGARAWTIRLAGYALEAGPDRVVTLPIVVELLARLSTQSLTITRARRLRESEPVTWRLRVRTGAPDPPRGIVRVRDGDPA